MNMESWLAWLTMVHDNGLIRLVNNEMVTHTQ